MSKKLNTDVLENELKGRSAFFQPRSITEPLKTESRAEVTQLSTRKSTQPRDTSRDNSRKTIPENEGELPTRDEIQEFSFRLRDELRMKTKVQAEVPYQWQEELEELANRLNVKKLELYRYIIGKFLGKVNRGSREGQ
jgi:hypothetical protein